MIMSTVRSSLVTNHPGFLSEPKRFNVAVTRAKRLLVVIGDTRMMSKAGRCWQRLILHADRGKSLFKHQDVSGIVEGVEAPIARPLDESEDSSEDDEEEEVQDEFEDMMRMMMLGLSVR